MSRNTGSAGWLRIAIVGISAVATAVLISAFTRSASWSGSAPALQQQPARQQQVERGRQLVLEHACSACHGGALTPNLDGWLVGVTKPLPGLEFLICIPLAPDAPPTCFRTRPRNLTPDNLTGMGRFSERQIFNALRFGLRPGETPDVEITSSAPGQGNFPANPKYLAPPMPWMAWRHMPDADLWAIAAYLKDAVKPVRNLVEDSEGPTDFWAGAYAQFGADQPYPAPPFPIANEVRPTGSNVNMQQVLRGRQVLIQHDCGACHGGGSNPGAQGWLAGIGVNPFAVEFPAGPPTQPPMAKPCSEQPAGTVCFMMRPRNLTPHATNGTGGYTDRQIFNALRYGLRPSTTPDVTITSNVPGQGNFPAKPDYLGIGMPWPAWRYMSDDDIWAIIAYLKHGLKPVDNKVPDSEAPPDKWASVYTADQIGPHPAPPFPAAHERR